MVMLGKTGSGKSSLFNALLGSETVYLRCLSESSTMRVQRKRFKFLDLNTELVDTPGIYSTYYSHEDTALEIAKAMDPAPHVILYVIKVDTFTEEDLNTFYRIKKYFNNDITGHMIVVCTHGDTLTETGSSPEEFYTKASPNLRMVIEEANRRCIVVSTRIKNTDSSSPLSQLSPAVRSLISDTSTHPFYMASRGPEIIRRNVKAAESREVANTQTGRDLQDQIKQLEDEIKQQRSVHKLVQIKKMVLISYGAFLIGFCLAMRIRE